MPPSEYLQEILHRNYPKPLGVYYNEKLCSGRYRFSHFNATFRSKIIKSLYSVAIIERGNKHLELNGKCDFVLNKAQPNIKLERSFLYHRDQRQ